MNFLSLINLMWFLGMMWVPDQFIKSHRCIPIESISCLVDTLYACPPGFYDGCLTSESNNHKCLPSSHGVLCSEPMRLNCPKNFEDGCLRDLAQIHQCLPLEGDLCSNNKHFSCPFGFEDLCKR